jgi:hypothetical protein
LRHEDGHAKAYEVCCQRWKLVVATLRPAVFDPYVLALEISGFAQALMKVGHEVCIW